MKSLSDLFPGTVRLLLCVALWRAADLRAANPISLRAGPVTLMFEPDNASIRYVRVGPHEILRGITAPVRNQFWGTVLPAVSGLQVKDDGDHFSLSFDALCREREIDFLWHGTLRGTRDGEIEFSFDGTARSDFQKNRIGFCVLHGPSAAGRPWEIENVRGEKSAGRFPDYISPHQPAKDIRAIAHELEPGLWAHVRMEGDTFEMEDQRNWTDASFKTYCTPLALPYPVAIATGTRIQQKVSIRLQGAIPKPGSQPAPKPTLTLTREQVPLPRLGLQVSSLTTGLSRTEKARLRALHLDHLRVDVALTNADWAERLRDATLQARTLGINLQIGLRLGDNPASAWDRLLNEARALHPPAAVWWVIGADATLHRQATERLGTLGGKAWVGPIHEDINFTQLNRVRPSPEMQQVVGYGVTPQIHAFDNRSMMETLPILTDTVRSARQFIGSNPLIITPVTLRLQTLAQAPLPGQLPANVDPRQRSLFAAAWTAGCIKYLAESGVHAITCYETVGWKGVMESAGGPPLPDKFPSRPGEIFPIYHVLHAIGEFAGGGVLRFPSSDTLSVAGLALVRGDRLRLLVANLTDQPQTTLLRGVSGKLAIRSLNGENTASGARAEGGFGAPSLRHGNSEIPLLLPAYGIVRIDSRQ